jgi:eukaryotic-like serine/threonine-protein kinase
MEGTVVAGRYRLQGLIGEGGLALVYRATDTVLERTVAIKILRDRYASDPEAVERFRSEALAAAKLNHPNIVQIYDTGSDNGKYYIVMEYLPEPDLKVIFTQYAPLPSRKVMEVITQCCRALAAAHRAGVVHRDVKPQNILFSNDGIAKLSDFGIAAAAGLNSLSANGMVLGSANYISPEQAQGKPVGPQSDLYSLGCVMYEALTGHTPFTAGTPSQIAAMHVQQRPVAPHVLNPNVTPSEEFIVSKAMTKDPARRYQNADEMLADLERLAAGEDLDRTGVLRPTREATMPLYAAPAPEPPPAPAPVVSRPSVRPAPPPPRGTNGPAIAALILLLVLALVVVGVVAFKLLAPKSEKKQIAVPSLLSLTEREARQSLTRNGLSVGSVTWEQTDQAPAGTVVRQTPRAGDLVEEGRPVSLVIAQGKEIVQVVSVVGLELMQAQQQLARASLTLGEVVMKFSRQPKDVVIGQSPKAGVGVEKGTAVDLEVSKGPEAPPSNAEVTMPEGGTEPPAAEETSVEVEPDPDYKPTSPQSARWIVRVTNNGSTPGREVTVYYAAAGESLVQAATWNMDPGETKQVKFPAKGATTVEIRVDGKTISKKTYEPPPASLTGP